MTITRPTVMEAINFLHLLSSSTFIYCYILAFYDLTTAMCWGLAALFVRQFGHAILEPPCLAKEKLLLGFNTRNKTLIVVGYVLILLIPIAEAQALSWEIFGSMIGPIALNWFLWTVPGRARTHLEAQFPNLDDLVRQADYPSCDGYIRLFSALAAARLTLRCPEGQNGAE